MHLDIYQCDRERCRAEKPAVHLASTEGGASGPHPPDGWFLLDARFWGKDFTFCSMRCLENWARQERAGGRP